MTQVSVHAAALQNKPTGCTKLPHAVLHPPESRKPVTGGLLAYFVIHIPEV